MPRVEMTHRCARCGHRTQAASLAELLFEPPEECPNCGGPIRVQAHVGKPVSEVLRAPSGEPPEGAGYDAIAVRVDEVSEWEDGP